MTHDFETISHLLKKTEWPDTDRSLAFRIQSAVPCMNTNIMAVSPPPAFMRSPVLSFVAIALSIIIGMASGTLASPPAKAEPQKISLYEGTGTTLISLYTGQTGAAR